MREGETINLYKQDYSNVVAFATSPAAEMFFGAVLSGIIPRMLYDAEADPIYIGKVKAETDDEIHLEEAVSPTPKQLLQVHEAFNYSPLDCMRGLWFEAKTLRPDLLQRVTVKKNTVRQRMDLVGK